jgi:hypothetical protein
MALATAEKQISGGFSVDFPVEVNGREFAAFLRRMGWDTNIIDSLSGKLHHKFKMAEKHLGFAALRSSVINREPQTIGMVRKPSFSGAG